MARRVGRLYDHVAGDMMIAIECNGAILMDGISTVVGMAVAFVATPLAVGVVLLLIPRLDFGIG